MGTYVSPIPKAHAHNHPEGKGGRKLALLNALWDPVPAKPLNYNLMKESLDHKLPCRPLFSPLRKFNITGLAEELLEKDGGWGRCSRGLG